MKKRKAMSRKLGTAMMLAGALTVGAAVTAQAAAPAQVKITAGSASESKIILKWGKVSSAENYKLYVKSGKGKTKLLATRSAKKSTAVKITNLKNNTTYTFYVSAVNKKGEEGKKSSGKQLTPQTKKPGQPINITLSDLGKKSVTVSWDKASGATGYEILRKQSDGSYKKIASTTKRKVTLKGLKTGSTYQIAVRAVRKKNGGTTKGYVSKLVQFSPTSLSSAVSSVAPFSRYSAGYRTDPTIVYASNVAEKYANTRIPVPSSYQGKYLLWENAYTQHLYVFKRKNLKSKWTFDRVFICASGAGGGTMQRWMTLGSKGYLMKFSNIQWAYYPTSIESGAIHSQLYYPNGTLWTDADLGHAVSHGCIRLRKATAKWVQDNIPSGTRLWVC